jgi:hypothetical protein
VQVAGGRGVVTQSTERGQDQAAGRGTEEDDELGGRSRGVVESLELEPAVMR